MLALDSPRWHELTHAYGDASDIPALLRQLSDLPASVGRDEPWFSLWSALAHQGDVYSASFAAVPHVIEALASNPMAADSTYFQFPAWVESCRAERHVDIPDDLREPYFKALSTLPRLVAAASDRPWDDEDLLPCALAAIAAAKGEPLVAQAVLELDAKVAREFLDWFHSR
jgi:hypothetical protein